MIFMIGCGCGGVTGGLDGPTRAQIQKAIDELAMQPSRWDQVLKNLTANLGGEMRETIKTLNEEMQDLGRELVEDGGIEVRCNTDFVGKKVRDALQQILNNNKPYYSLSPWVCHLRPEEFYVDEKGKPKDPTITITGFGFTTVNVSNVRILITDENGSNPQSLKTTPNYISTYRIKLNIQDIQFSTKPRNKLRVQWGDDTGNHTDVAILISPTPVPTTPPTPLPLPTAYQIRVKTGCQSGAGTDAKVYITLYGTVATSSETRLDTLDYNDFEKCDDDYYRFNSNQDLGDLQMIRIRHDNTEDDPGWFLESVRITNLRTNKTWDFPCKRWLAVDEEDHQISRQIRPNGPCQ
jgi:hypothetical protein